MAKNDFNLHKSCEMDPENLKPECVEGFAAVYRESPESIQRLSTWDGDVGLRARLAKRCFEYLNTEEGMV